MGREDYNPLPKTAEELKKEKTSLLDQVVLLTDKSALLEQRVVQLEGNMTMLMAARGSAQKTAFDQRPARSMSSSSSAAAASASATTVQATREAPRSPPYSGRPSPRGWSSSSGCPR